MIRQSVVALGLLLLPGAPDTHVPSAARQSHDPDPATGRKEAGHLIENPGTLEDRGDGLSIQLRGGREYIVRVAGAASPHHVRSVLVYERQSGVADSECGIRECWKCVRSISTDGPMEVSHSTTAATRVLVATWQAGIGGGGSTRFGATHPPHTPVYAFTDAKGRKGAQLYFNGPAPHHLRTSVTIVRR